MSLKIRLARRGAKKRPSFRIVVADSRSPRDGRFIDRLGHYHPLLPSDHADRVLLDVEKAKAWIAKGAQPTDRVARFLDAAGVMTRPERVNPKKGEPGKKAQERATERAQAEEDARAAAAQAEAAPAEAEAPAETAIEATGEPAEGAAPAEATEEAGAAEKAG